MSRKKRLSLKASSVTPLTDKEEFRIAPQMTVDVITEGLNATKAINENYVVVFIEDGSTIQNCRSFKYNIHDLVNKYKSVMPKKSHNLEIAAQNAFNARAYKELLEECTRLMRKKELYKTMYTLDGEPIETLEDLKNLCETR